MSNEGRIFNCHFYGSIDGLGGNQRSGGIAGYIAGFSLNGSTIAQSSNSGNIVLTEKSCSYGSSAYVGGIAGIVYDKVSRVISSVNRGNVRINAGAPSVDHTSQAGGVVAKSSGTVENCYNMGNVVASETFTGDNVSAGGIVADTVGSSRISQCYNVGGVWGTNLGGIVGKIGSNATVEDCYWNKESMQYVGSILLPVATRKGIGQGEGVVTSLSSTAMKQRSSYDSFDFVNIWSINSGKNEGYPILQRKAPLYRVAVVRGSGSSGTDAVSGAGGHEKGSRVEVIAPKPNEGYRFSRWTSEDVAFLDENSATTSFVRIVRYHIFFYHQLLHKLHQEQQILFHKQDRKSVV